MHYLPKKAFGIVLLLVAFVCIATSSFRVKDEFDDGKKDGKDSVASIAAFMEVYKVLKSPRCMNCHPAGEIPLQSDDKPYPYHVSKKGERRPWIVRHEMCQLPPTRKFAWRAHAPRQPEMGAAAGKHENGFENKMPHELALQVVDYNRNGHKNKEQLLKHARDTLVKSGWNMGGGRMPPPLSYAAFLKVWDTWIKTGAYAPAK